VTKAYSVSAHHIDLTGVLLKRKRRTKRICAIGIGWMLIVGVLFCLVIEALRNAHEVHVQRANVSDMAAFFGRRGCY
jgi:hypothetical protein